MILAIALMVIGTFTASRMEVDVFPDLNAPTVVVMTEAQGMAPEEVERLVSFPIETAVNGATNVRRVRSSSTTGFSVVWIEFDWGTDIYKARQIISEKLATVSEALPETVGKPTLGPQSSILGEVMIIGLTSDSVSLQDLRTTADWTIRPRLLSTGGVAQVAVIGGEIKEFQVLLSPNRMKHYGVTMDDVLPVVKNMTVNSTGGVLYEYGNEYIVRGMLATADVVKMGKSVVKRNGDVPVLLENIAEVTIGAKAPRLGVASERGKPAVLITVTKQPNTNTLELTAKLDKAVEDLKKSVPKGVNISTDIFRQSRFIESSIDNVQKSLIEGSVFVIIVLFFFLMNYRTTVISLVALPLSLMIAILILKWFGFTINTMSLGGMAIAIGSLVDDAIVDVENVYKHLRRNHQLAPSERRGAIEVVFEASKEVRMPILNSTLIIITSFLPLFFLNGMEGRMLVPLGVSFIAALVGSTIIALTLTPVMSSYMLSTPRALAGSDKEPFLARYLKRVYSVALEWTLKNNKKVLYSTIAAFVVSVGIFLTLGRSFLPSFNEGSLTINVSTLPGISLDESDKIGRIAEKQLLSVPEVQTVARKTGRAELDEHALGVNTSEIEAPFVLGKRSRDEFMADVRRKLSIIKGANIEIGQPISHRIDAMLSGTRANIAIKLFGTDLNNMYALGNQIKGTISNVKGVADLNVEQQVERPQLQIRPKRELLAKYGISLPEFSEFVNIALAGQVVSQVYDDGKTYDLTLKVNDTDRNSIDRIRELMIDASNAKVALGQVADVISTSGPNTINRENVQRKIVVSANVEGRDLRSVVNEIQERVNDNIKLPEGYHIEYGGQFESEQAASRMLTFTSIISLLVIFLLLYYQFKNLGLAGIVMINLPLALIGGVISVWMTSGIVSIPAIIGFISLFGIATRNGILLVSHYNDLNERGLSVEQCVLQGSLDRLNPILMTAFSSAFALIPLALGGSLPGNEIQSPLAKVVLGGLITSTILNGFIIPIVYTIYRQKEEKKCER